MTTGDPGRLLFVYGTLLPGEERWSFLERFVVGDGRVDAVAGRLYDTGEGYPAAAFDPDAPFDSPRVAGQVFELAEATLVEALEVLDEVEDAVLGLYRRVRVDTDAGLSVWAYAHGEGLTLTPIESGDWRTHPR
jgi:gamma-glutamylcyclotransferase (GGCT)/AIG2-like uncharacterized protein YtfP